MIEIGRIDHGTRIAEAAGCLLDKEHDVVISRTDDYGKLLGGMIFCNYTGRSISVHIAGFDPHWISRNLLWMAFDYPFVQLKCENLFCQVKSDNEHTIKFVEKMGFKRETVISDVYPDSDLLVSRLRATECRWLGLRPRITSGGNIDAGREGSVH